MVTLMLALVNLGCFVLELSRGSQADLLLRRWGLVPSDVLASPAAWVTLVTSLFLHAGWLHLLSNVLYLAVFGGGVEQRLGPARYLGLYLASGILGGLAYVVAQPASDAPAVGASGAIAGVIAANLVFVLRRTVASSVPALGLLALWLLTQLFSGVAWWAHLGGLAGGLVLTRVLRPVASRR